MANNTFIEDFIKPSKIIANEIADKKSQIIAAKPELLNISDETSYDKCQELYDNSNWNIQRTKMVRSISLYGGTCLFLNELNSKWQILQTNNITQITRDSAGNEEVITLYVNLIKGNVGNYWMYQTHSSKRIFREVREVPKEGSTQANSITSDNALKQLPKVAWDSFLLDANITLKEEINTNTMTAFIIQNMYPIDEGIFSLSDYTKAQSQILLLDLAFESLVYNMRAARVRIVINKSAGSIEENSEVEGDKFLLGGTILVTQNTSLPDQNAISMAQPDPNILDASWKSYEKAIIEVYTRVNLARPDDADGAQKSSLEVMQIRDSEASGMEKLISLIQATYKKILKAYGIIENLELGEDFGWEVQRLDVQTEMDLLDNIEKMLTLKLITKVDAISLARKIDPASAEAEYKKILKESEENEETQTPTDELGKEESTIDEESNLSNIEQEEVNNAKKE